MKVITTEKVPIKMWLDDIEPQALDQAKNLANLPFVFRHIALAPDCHLGYGMPIGGIMATTGVVIPNAVGVDIGCFTGDTLVPTLSGVEYTLKELTQLEDPFYVYSVDEAGQIVPGKAVAKKTRTNAELMLVVVSGGRRIECTPDHKFMLLDGTYREAQHLQPADSLMPLYRTYQTRDGYEMVRSRSGTAALTHKRVAEAILGFCPEGQVVHHKNGMWFDNRPENLVHEDARKHNRDHARLKSRRLKSEEFKLARLQTLQEKGFYDPSLYGKKAAVGTENILRYMDQNQEEWLEKVKDNGKRGAKYLTEFNKRNNSTVFTCDQCGREVKGKGGFVRHTNACKGTNHKVLFTQPLEARSDVYCLTVDEHHNFALSAGVFVHNCGVIAVRTNLIDLDKAKLKTILGKIRATVPVGFKHQKTPQPELKMPNVNLEGLPIVTREFQSARKQLGTLGGGNHFCEVQRGDGNIWIMVHSGSRNLGKQVADHYNKVAVELNRRWHTSVPKEHQLAFLPLDTEEAQAYLREMEYCVAFAFANRKQMVECVLDAIRDVAPEMQHEEPINIAHNYAALENHFGQNVLVHRKGATRARKGELGIIPGSQGTKSYIVRGKGNRESFNSCSHGAGRRMGRKAAQRNLDFDQQVKQLDDLGILHSIRNAKDLDEAPGAYKDIKTVMEQQRDLVDIEVELSPLAVVKG